MWDREEVYPLACDQRNNGGADVFLVRSSNHPPHELVPILLQPLVPFPVVRENSQHLRVESLAMVHLFPVTKLVDDHTVDHLGGSQHQQTVEVEIALGRATPPAGALVADRYASIGDADQRRIVFDALWDVGQCFFREDPYLLRADSPQATGEARRLSWLAQL